MKFQFYLQKAFGTTDHNTLLQKQQRMGCQMNSLIGLGQIYPSGYFMRIFI